MEHLGKYVGDPDSPISVNSALRYWGCTVQAGAQVSGAVGIACPYSNAESMKEIKEKFSLLPFASIPHLPKGYLLDWNSIMPDTVDHDARVLLSLPASHGDSAMSPVKFEAA